MFHGLFYPGICLLPDLARTGEPYPVMERECHLDAEAFPLEDRVQLQDRLLEQIGFQDLYDGMSCFAPLAIARNGSVTGAGSLCPIRIRENHVLIRRFSGKGTLCGALQALRHRCRLF